MGNAFGWKASSTEEPIEQIKERGRSCTDMLCCLAFLAFWAGSIAIFVVADRNGANPDLLLRGVDYNGRICGKSAGVENLPFAAWPVPTEAFDFKICVADCSQTMIHDAFTQIGTQHNSTSFVSSYCLPTGVANDKVSGQFAGAQEQFSRAMGDVSAAWEAILASFFVTLFLAFIYVGIMRLCARFIVWGTVLLILAGGVMGTYGLLKKAQETEQDPDLGDRADSLRTFGYMAGVATFLYLCVILFLRRRIQMAIEVAEETSKALTDLPSLILFPVIPIVGAILFLIFWIYWGLYVFSMKEETQQPMIGYDVNSAYWNGELATRDSNGNRLFTKLQRIQNDSIYAYFFFAGFWNLQFLVYFGYSVLAGAIAYWYFTPYQNEQKRIISNPVVDAFKRVLRFHLGSVALGSFFLAVIHMLRSILQFVKEKTSDRDDNKLKKCVYACMICCLKCLDCCLDKLSKDAFIWQAVYGDPFCPSAFRSFTLIWNNLIRVAAVTVVGETLVGLGKVMISVLTTGLMSVVLLDTPKYAEELSSILVPVMLIFVISWLTATLVLEVFDTGVETIFLCFLIDSTANPPEKMRASQDLKDIVDKFSDESRRKAIKRGVPIEVE